MCTHSRLKGFVRSSGLKGFVSPSGLKGFTISLLLSIACVRPSDQCTKRPAIEPASEASVPASSSEFGPWQAPSHREHSLVGRAWDPARAAPIDRDALVARLAAARFVLLGETHDHPDHHRLQGELISALVAAGRSPAVVFEMLDPSKQPAIDGFVSAVEREIDGFADTVAWAESGWPEWSLYRPVFVATLDARLPILAGELPRSETRRYMKEGLAMFDPGFVERFGLGQPLAPDLQAALLDEMFAAHCDMVPREQLGPMVEIQRLRDARMADALLRGAEARGQAVLIAGSGHARRDWGVPRVLAELGVAADQVVSIGFVSVDPERDSPSEYELPYDLVVFTPDIEHEDHCAGMRS